MNEDLARALALPVYDAEHYLSAWRRWSLLLRKHPDAPWLKPAQGAMLEHLHQMCASGKRLGVFGNLGVGSGKTLVLLLAQLVSGEHRVVALIPPGFEQELQAQYQEWLPHYNITMPSVMPYSRLSRKRGAEELSALRPDLLICDEAHFLRNTDSARTKRVIRQLRNRPQTRVIMMSGTITAGSVQDYAHLLYACLREESPGPTKRNEISKWAAVIDDSGDGSYEDYQELQPLLHWAGKANYEDAFHKRWSTAPGCLKTSTMSVDASIHMRLIRTKPNGDVQDTMRRIADEWQMPDGTDIVEASHKAMLDRNLSVGFWYQLGPIPSPEWAEARANWSREMRYLLNYRSREGFDSPALIEEAVRESTYADYQPAKQALLEWDSHRHLQRPPSKSVWVDSDFVLRVVERWVKENKRGIVWYKTRALGRLLKDAGYDVRGQADPAPAKNVDVACLSLTRFQQGFNLQFYDRMLFLEPSPSSLVYEQAIGRVHRQGQTADCVFADVLMATWRHSRDLDMATSNAESVQRQSGQQQRLLLASREVVNW